MHLTQEEQAKLVELMNKVSFPLPKEVFYAWCLNFVNICVELILLGENEKEGQIFLAYREDEFYKGWHMPGSIILPNDKVDNVLERIVSREVKGQISKPEFVFWYEYMKGNGLGESPRGQTMSLFFKAVGQDNIETENSKFFHIDKLPDNIILEHVPVLDKIRKEILN